jgi:hypothetical protein
MVMVPDAGAMQDDDVVAENSMVMGDGDGRYAVDLDHVSVPR